MMAIFNKRPVLWCVMGFTAAGMLWFFRSRGWLGAGGHDDTLVTEGE